MKKWVSVNSLGDDRGVTVTIGKSQLEAAGLDPDADLEVNRYVFENRGEIRLRFRTKD